MKNQISTLLPLIAGLLLSGCAQPQGPYLPTERKPSPELENTTVILDQEIAGEIAVDGQKAERTPQGKLKGIANLRNRTNQDLTIQVQTVFRDADGFSIHDDTAWETIILTANETRTVSGASTSKKAARYTIRIRMPR